MVTTSKAVAPADLLALLQQRRSTRAFADRAVERADIEALVEAARWAPSPTNRQPWKFVSITSEAIKLQMCDAVTVACQQLLQQTIGEDAQALEDYLRNFVFFSKAPVLFAMLLRRTKNRLDEGSDMQGESGLLAMGAAMQNLLLAAEANGMAACPMSGPMIARPALEEILKVRDPWQLKVLIPVGWPTELTAPPPERKRLDLVWQEL